MRLDRADTRRRPHCRRSGGRSRLNTPTRDRYDAVVVGAGLGGLSAAAFLATAGRRTLLVERNKTPGGYAAALERPPYRFDSAICAIARGAEGELANGLLTHLGVDCELRPIDGFYRSLLPGLTFDAPIGPGRLAEAHAAVFPGERHGIERFFELCERVFHEAHGIGLALSWEELDRAPERYAALIGYRTATLAQVLQEHLSDDRLQALIGSVWPYLGLPPSRLSFFTYAELVAVLSRGLLYPVGGFGRLADALAAAFEASGGELLLGTEATSIVLDGRRATGVRLGADAEVRGGAVVSNVDARRTFGRMLDPDALPAAFVRRLARSSPSVSAYVLYAATTLELGGVAAHETLLGATWDHEEAHARTLAGRPGGKWASVPTLTDATLAPAGEHLVVLRSLAARQEQMDAAAYTELLLGELDAAFPGLRDGLSFVELRTPAALEQQTLGSEGAMYGWELAPGSTGGKRLRHRTPIDGLYLAGHWTQPGAGAYLAILSGMYAARAVLAETGDADLVPDFRSHR